DTAERCEHERSIWAYQLEVTAEKARVTGDFTNWVNNEEALTRARNSKCVSSHDSRLNQPPGQWYFVRGREDNRFGPFNSEERCDQYKEHVKKHPPALD